MIVIDAAAGPDRRVRPTWPCPHRPPCPDAYAPDRDAARIRIGHPDQGWWLLCNGVVAFDDTGDLLPDGHTVAPPGACGPTAAWHRLNRPCPPRPPPLRR